MTTAAKVFVVLLVLFSVAFSMIAVTFVVQQSNWKKLAMDFQVAYQAAVVEKSSFQALAKTTEVQLQRQINQLSDQIEGLNSKLAEARVQLDGKASQLVKLESDRDAAQAQSKRSTQLQELDKKRADRMETRNKDLLDKTTEFQKRNLDLDRRVQELTQQVTILDEQCRALKEQRYALEQQLGAVEKGRKASTPAAGQGRSVAATPAGPAAAPIKGQVLETSGSIASISVGSADGVVEGMSFVVYRGSNYLGKLKITTIEPNRAGGDLTLVRGDIRPKDSVRDERSFNLEQ